MLKLLLWSLLAAAICVAAFILFLVICALCVDPKKTYPENSRFYRTVLNIATAAGMFICGVKVNVEGADMLPEGRFLFVCNHRSKFDPIVTWLKLRKHDLAFVSKPENFKVPVFGRLIRRCCFMPIDRSSARHSLETFNHAADLIKADKVSVAIYPEGTRNIDCNGLLPFHSGVFMVAQEAGVPVVVAAIDGTEDIKRNFPLHKTIVTLKIVDVMDAQYVMSHRRADISARAREDMAGALGIDENVILTDEKASVLQ